MTKDEAVIGKRVGNFCGEVEDSYPCVCVIRDQEENEIRFTHFDLQDLEGSKEGRAGKL